jgi:RimJ/RimL family protein N-acetyltransferase
VKDLSIETARLQLVAATEELVRAEIEDRATFSALLQAQVPTTWPPQFNDTHTQTFTLQKLTAHPEQVGWWTWYFILQGNTDADRVLIGNGGFKGCPTDGSVEVGYSILQQFQNAGFGSEATAGLVDWAFGQQVDCVLAETLPELGASIRVLEKNGFLYIGAGSEEGVIRYRKERS